MASITIRSLDDEVKRRLRVRAAEHGRSMEEEVREILPTTSLQRSVHGSRPWAALISTFRSVKPCVSSPHSTGPDA